MSKTVLITGIDGFTGKHLTSYLEGVGYDVYGTSLSASNQKTFTCDIRKKEQLTRVLQKVKPAYVIHLSAVSFAAHENNLDFYDVNCIGTMNLLDLLLELHLLPKKILLASSATVYGNQNVTVLDESLCPQPANHYGASKYAMECLARGYFSQLPINIIRPFNYTGVGQSEHFLIPKIVKHFKEKKTHIELGNLDVIREFNDIEYVCKIYEKLLENNVTSEIVNISSERGIKLFDVIAMMNRLAGYKIEVKVNPLFVRKDEIKSLTGSKKKLIKVLGEIEQCGFEQTLKRMLDS